ncbi:MAG: hypothetical protein PUP91_33710 [Rhizonema sp. PD37]|nr:hypothetical protein [Rhizonema sp. PD37]
MSQDTRIVDLDLPARDSTTNNSYVPPIIFMERHSVEDVQTFMQKTFRLLDEGISKEKLRLLLLFIRL